MLVGTCDRWLFSHIKPYLFHTGTFQPLVNFQWISPQLTLASGLLAQTGLAHFGLWQGSLLAWGWQSCKTAFSPGLSVVTKGPLSEAFSSAELTDMKVLFIFSSKSLQESECMYFAIKCYLFSFKGPECRIYRDVSFLSIFLLAATAGMECSVSCNL